MSVILLVDDDVELCELVGEFLGGENFSVEVAFDGRSGLEKALTGAFDLVVLDVMMPQLGGFEVLRRLRETSQVPVVMLTARGEEVDRIVGLEMGADDYLPKPFNPRELAARIRAVLRRAEAAPGTSSSITVDDVTVDLGARTIRVDDAEITLTGVEFSLLETLLRTAGSVVTRNELSANSIQ